MRPVPLADWMAGLDGRRDLSELTIPGTHDSGARRGGPRSRTQTLDIARQLESGIRFFDIRLKDRAGVLRLYHGDTDERTELAAGVLAPMQAFLAAHPGESLIMSVKQEDAGDQAAFAGAFEDLVARHPASFHLGATVPRLADARGRILVLRRFAGGATGLPAPPSTWRSNAAFEIGLPGGRLVVEDRWDLGWALPGRTGGKWAAVVRSLDAAAASPTGWFITFTSAAGDLNFPCLVARGLPRRAGVNQRLLDHLAGRPGPHRLGTVVMDFPPRRLIQSLVDANPRADKLHR